MDSIEDVYPGLLAGWLTKLHVIEASLLRSEHSSPCVRLGSITFRQEHGPRRIL